MRRPLVHLVLLVLVLMGCRSNEADNIPTPSGETDSPEVTVDPEVERWFRETSATAAATFIVGDRVRIELKGLPEYSISRQIPPDGAIPLYRAGRSIDARGKTIQQLEAEIAAVYAAKLEAYVTVDLVEMAPRYVYVTGAVSRPQKFPLMAGERIDVLQAVTLAGGPDRDADLRGVTIRRFHPGRGEVVSSPALDLDSVREHGEQRDNLVVLSGDTVVVPVGTERKVQILGNVSKPGPLRWRRDMTLSVAISEAGGFGKFAALSSIVVIRRTGERFSYDYNDYLDGEVRDLMLLPGDVIYIEERLL